MLVCEVLSVISHREKETVNTIFRSQQRGSIPIDTSRRERARTRGGYTWRLARYRALIHTHTRMEDTHTQRGRRRKKSLSTTQVVTWAATSNPRCLPHASLTLLIASIASLLHRLLHHANTRPQKARGDHETNLPPRANGALRVRTVGWQQQTSQQQRDASGGAFVPSAFLVLVAVALVISLALSHAHACREDLVSARVRLLALACRQEKKLVSRFSLAFTIGASEKGGSTAEEKTRSIPVL